MIVLRIILFGRDIPLEDLEHIILDSRKGLCYDKCLGWPRLTVFCKATWCQGRVFGVQLSKQCLGRHFVEAALSETVKHSETIQMLWAAKWNKLRNQNASKLHKVAQDMIYYMVIYDPSQNFLTSNGWGWPRPPLEGGWNKVQDVNFGTFHPGSYVGKHGKPPYKVPVISLLSRLKMPTSKSTSYGGQVRSGCMTCWYYNYIIEYKSPINLKWSPGNRKIIWSTMIHTCWGRCLLQLLYTLGTLLRIFASQSSVAEHSNHRYQDSEGWLGRLLAGSC